MKNKIAYFMERDTRLILDNLSKVIISENVLLINYTILRRRRKVKNGKIPVVRYLKDKNRIIFYDTIKKYNSNIYKGFIEWAEDNKIEWYSFGKEEI